MADKHISETSNFERLGYSSSVWLGEVGGGVLCGLSRGVMERRSRWPLSSAGMRVSMWLAVPVARRFRRRSVYKDRLVVWWPAIYRLLRRARATKCHSRKVCTTLKPLNALRRMWLRRKALFTNLLQLIGPDAFPHRRAGHWRPDHARQDPVRRFAALVFTTPAEQSASWHGRWQSSPHMLGKLFLHQGDRRFASGGDRVLENLMKDSGLADVKTRIVRAPLRLPRAQLTP